MVKLMIELGYYKLGFEITAHELEDGDVLTEENTPLKQ